jgi:hypothetical protein
MEREEQVQRAAGVKDFEAESLSRDGRGPEETGGRKAPGWRAWVISVIVAVILSVTATLLLGGSFRLPGAGVSGGCGPGGVCCPPPLEEGK